MLIAAQAVRRGVTRALVSVDLPFGPVQEGTRGAVRAAIRMVKEAGADLVKIDGAPDFPDAVTAVARAGIPVCSRSIWPLLPNGTCLQSPPWPRRARIASFRTRGSARG